MAAVWECICSVLDHLHRDGHVCNDQRLHSRSEWLERGDESALHVIICDEMDAFARTRGTLTSDSSGVRDSIVNQLLAKIDGVSTMDNVLVIGLTNRKDLIEPAMLRPGRLEVRTLTQMSVRE